MREGGSRLCFVRDPDGYRIELIEQPLARVAAIGCPSETRPAVIDLGLELLPARRLHAGEPRPRWWKRTDEIHEAVRVGEGLDAAGELQPEPMERALETIELFAHFCRATGIDERAPGRHQRRSATPPTARSSSRRARERSGLRDRGALAARRRPATATSPRSTRRRWPTASCSTSAAARCSSCASAGRAARDVALVAARRRAHDRALPARRARRRSKQLKALRAHVHATSSAPPAGCPSGAAERAGSRHRRHGAQPRGGGAAGAPTCRRSASRASCSSARRWTSWSTDLADLPAGRARRRARDQARARRPDPGRRGGRSQAVMEAGGFDALEVTEAGLREGVFFATLLGAADPPLFDDVRGAQRAQPRRASTTPTSRTSSTSPRSRWRCATRWPTAGRPRRRRRASASCCGRPRCCTTSARRSTTTTTTSTRAT